MTTRLRVYLAMLLALYAISVFGICFVHKKEDKPKTWEELAELRRIHKELKAKPQLQTNSFFPFHIKIGWFTSPNIILPRIAIATLIFGALAGIGFLLFHSKKPT